MMTFLILLVVGYFLGAIPFGVLIARANGVDIMKVGSGNIGATNVIRGLGKGWGITVFVLDMLKGTIPALLARWTISEPIAGIDPQAVWFLCGLAAVVGHAKSPFLRFRGGKGVSTAMGAGLGAIPLVALAAFTLFAILLATIRYMSVASVVAVSAAPVFAYLIPNQSPAIVPILLILAVVVTLLHRKNITRLREGTEPKFSFKKTSPAPNTEDRTPNTEEPPPNAKNPEAP
jgi:glycerol-3-phosphate acyltransferase PlsY